MSRAKRLQRLEDLTPDPLNANRGTARGHAVIDASLAQDGTGRSIVVDRNGVIIAGNQTHEKAVEKGLGIVVVETHGHELVVHRRLDLDMIEDPARARRLALNDNRAAQLGIDFDPEVLKQYAEIGAILPEAFHPEEFARLTAAAPASFEEALAQAAAPIPTFVPTAATGSGPAPGTPGGHTEDVADPPRRRPEGQPIIQYNLVFDDEAQQLRFYGLIRALKQKYPDLPTIGARIDQWIQDLGAAPATA